VLGNTNISYYGAWRGKARPGKAWQGSYPSQKREIIFAAGLGKARLGQAWQGKARELPFSKKGNTLLV